MGEKLHRILEERQGSLVSGEDIADRIRISRADDWKRVKFLREEGCAFGGAGERGTA